MSTQEYMQKVVEDVGEDTDFNSGAWVSATNYVNAFGGTVTGCLGDIDNFLKKGKLGTNYEKDITVGAAMILVNVSVFTPKPSKHYLNITKRNVVEVFRKDTAWSKEAKKRSNDRKINIQQNLSEVDKLIDQGKSNDEILIKRITLLNDLQELNNRNAMEISQKAKIRWSIEGDENFQSITMV
ncbi:transposase, MuDR, MULE transposase domain protein [Tanacetum coccineum]|uniref:Transposase, MuDR, MULE transposase domain protein n=1 Tax=Tanacetum coccineum TaxID=301880 RepID=A0ABQ5CF19_9ASTR